jgi:hypothetical protein
MRLLGAVIVTVALLLSGISASGAVSAVSAAPGSCRQQWQDLHALHGENGNPEGSGATQQLQARWDGYYDAAGRLAEEGTKADCEKIGAFAQAWAGLERLMYGLHPHDYLFQLRIANGDLRHFREFTGHNPGRQVMRAFRFLREQARGAAGDLAPLYAAAPAVATIRQTQVTGFLRDYRAAAKASRHATKARDWLRVIQDAELSEE